MLVEQFSDGKSEIPADVKLAVLRALLDFGALECPVQLLFALCAFASVLDHDSGPLAAEPLNGPALEVHAEVFTHILVRKHSMS